MRFAVTTVLAWSALALTVAPLSAQEPAPTKPIDIYKAAQDLKAEGRFDLAADRLKAFLEANPTDKDFLEVEARFGPTTFLKLRNVVKWDDNAAADADAKKTVDGIIAASVAANQRLNQDPARIARFVRNLGASAAEREFALDQLKLAKQAVVPVMVSELAGAADATLQAGIFTAVPQLPVATVPGFLASLDGLPDDLKGQMLAAVARRPDVVQLVDRAETDLTPHLWYLGTSPSPAVKAAARPLLEALVGPSSARSTADAELVRLAGPFVRHTAAFATKDALTNKVTVWQWDADKRTVKAVETGTAAAEEYYGLRNLRWAVERVPQSEVAQAAFLGLAAERAVTRANYRDLITAEPAVYQLLAAAPSPMLAGLLDTALAENRTALAVGVLQVMGDRGQRDTSLTATAKTTPYSKALAYPDPRVQFAAAVALLRAPNSAALDSRAKVVDVLRRALLADQDGATEGKIGRAIIADPNGVRGEKLASTFREIGYAAERFATGRQLLTRVGKGADFDLIVVDRHVADPTLTDVIGQLSADPNTARRSIFVVASSDRLKAPSVEPQLYRLALLVAAADTEKDIVVPPPYRFNPRLPDLKPDEARAENVKQRDAELGKLYERRLRRMQRLVEASDLTSPLTLQERLEIRLPHLTWAILAAEHDVTKVSAPRAASALADVVGLVRGLEGKNNPFDEVKNSENLTRVVNQMDTALDDEGRKRFAELQRRVLPDSVGVPADPVRDEVLEQQLTRQLRRYQAVALIPEVFTAVALEQDVKQAVTDPAQLPRSPEEKRATAKAAADWLRKIAVGELAGYDAAPAEGAMRSAVRLDDLAPLVIDGLAKMGTSDTQQALVTTAITGNRPLPIRVQAADAAARHAQAFGKQSPAMLADQVADAAAAEPDPVLKGKLAVLAQSVGAKATADFGATVRSFPVKLATPPAPKPDQPKDKDPNAPADPAKQPVEEKK